MTKKKGQNHIGGGVGKEDRKKILSQKCKETTFKKCWRGEEDSKYRKERKGRGEKGFTEKKK